MRRAADLARVLSGRARGGLGLWTGALKLAARVANPGGAEPRERVQLALTVVLTALSGAPLSSGPRRPGGSDDVVADAIDNLGFAPGRLILHGGPGIREPDPSPAADGGGGARRSGTGTGAGQGSHGVRADRGVHRITDRPVAALASITLVHKKVIDETAGAMVPLCLLPFAVVARRGSDRAGMTISPGWRARPRLLASLLRALPRKLHRLVRADGMPARYTPGQIKVFLATYSFWAEQHPDLALLLSRSTDDPQAP